MGRFGLAISRVVFGIMPEPFVFVLLLTALGLLFGAWLTPHHFTGLVNIWQGGFWDSLAFSMQVCVLLVAGYALAVARPMRRLFGSVSVKVTSARAAVFLTAFVSCLFASIHWGLGLIMAAFTARELGTAFLRRKRAIHYPLLVAAAYGGLMVWHAGVGGEALLAAARGIGASPAIALKDTLLSTSNFAVMIGLLFAVPFTLMLFQPADGKCVPPTVDQTAGSYAERVTPGQVASLAGRLERLPAVSVLAAVAGLAFLAYRPARTGSTGMELDDLNFVLIFLGILLHWRPKNYINAVVEAGKSAGTVLIQFPFYAGLAALVVKSGLVVRLTGIFVAGAGETMLAPMAFFSAGLVNVFVPLGGQQWMAQAETLLAAAKAVGVPPEKMVLAVAYGDGWTNMIQPFFALPLLAITRVEAREIFGYTALLMITGAIFFLMGLMV